MYLLRPLAAFILLAAVACRAPATDEPAGQELVWLSYDKGLETSKANGRPVFIDATATWCPPCKQFEKVTLRNPEIIETLRTSFVTVKIDVDAEPRHADTLRVNSLPTLVVMSSDGKEIDRLRGYHSPFEFNAWLKKHADS